MFSPTSDTNFPLASSGVTYKNGVLDWTLDCTLDLTLAAYNSVCGAIANSQLQSIAL
jgi:hypothetical protein